MIGLREKRPLIVCLAFLIIALSGVNAAAQGGGDPLGSLPAEAQSIVLAVNRVRSEAGLTPLAVNALLNQAAQSHVDDMIAHRRYGHRGSDGTYVLQRVARTGYPLIGRPGENWVAVRDAERAIRWWMSDRVHRDNILDPRWREIGVGFGPHPGGWGLIFVTNFTAGSDGQLAAQSAAEQQAPEPVTLEVPADGLDYAIEPGDTLIGIGVKYGVDWPLIAAANGLAAESVLRIGQIIRLPGVNTPVPSAQAVARIAQDDDAGAAPLAGPATLYTVQPGDTLSGIVVRFHVKWQDIAKANRLTEQSVLKIGLALRIPGSGEAMNMSLLLGLKGLD
jgi:LysM repeat protein